MEDSAVRRDTLLICCSEAAARHAATVWPLNPRIGFGCSVDGIECVASVESLRSRWTRITRRNPNVVVLDAPGEDVAKEIGGMVVALGSNQETSRRHSRRWIANLLANLSKLVWFTPAMSARDALRGVPAVLIGAGPSLDRNRHELERLRGSALFVGVNSATREVDCDVQVCLESNDIRPKLGEHPKIKCYSTICPPEHFDHGEGRAAPIWSGEMAMLPEQLTGVGRLHTSVSGTSAALSLALVWGCDPIILVGQDLAYTDGRIYAGCDTSMGSDGSADWGKWSDLDRPDNPLPKHITLEEVPAWGGDGVVSTDMALSALRAFMSSVPVGRTLINATEGGSHIPGWSDIRLSSVAVAYQTQEPWSLLRASLALKAPHVEFDGRGGFAGLRAWRDDTAEALQMIGHLGCVIQDAPDEQLPELGGLLLEGLASCRLLETWSYDGILALRSYRQAQKIGTAAEERTAALQDLRDAAVILAKDAMSLRELLLEQSYIP